MTKVRAKLRELFGVDLRSLALLRIGLGVCVLADLGTRAFDLVGLYTGRGVWPRELALAMQGTGVYLSAHYWASSHPALQAGLFTITGACAVALLVGWRTRLANLACWYFVGSLQVFQPLVYMGGDSILRLLLFWGLFLPLGARFSLDFSQGRVSPRSDQHFSGATVALLLQVCLIYWATGLHKSGVLWRNGQAVFYALQLDEYATPLGVRLRDEPALLESLTHGTLAIELFGPFLAFVPVYTAAFRVATITAFWLFHAGLAACMNIGLFPLFAMVAWLPFLPSQAWRWLGMGARNDLRDVRSLLASLAAIVVLAYICVLLAERTAIIRRAIPPPVLTIGRALRLQQTWVMFSPNPPRVSVQHEIRGRFPDGSELSEPAATSFRWIAYLTRFAAPPPPGDPLAGSLRRLGLYHCDRLAGAYEEASRMERVEIIAKVRRLWPVGPTEPVAQLLLDVSCP